MKPRAVALLALIACGGSPATPPATPTEPTAPKEPAATKEQTAGGIGLGNAPGLAPPSGEVAKGPPVRGRLAPELIQQVVRANFAGMRRCYEAGLARNPKLAGRISTKFVIERDGYVSSAMDVHDAPKETPLPNLPKDFDTRAQQDEPRFPDAEVVRCVAERFAKLAFPKPEGGIVTVVYPIVFAPGE